MHSFEKYHDYCSCFICKAIRKRANRLQMSVQDTIAMIPDKPRLVAAAEEEATRTGKTPGEVLSADIDAMMNLRYPGPLCITIKEATLTIESGEGESVLLSFPRVAHADDCPFCQGLLKLLAQVNQRRAVAILRGNIACTH